MPVIREKRTPNKKTFEETTFKSRIRFTFHSMGVRGRSYAQHPYSQKYKDAESGIMSHKEKTPLSYNIKANIPIH